MKITMVNRAVISVIAVMMLSQPTIGSIPLDDVFRTFYVQMGITNLSQEVFLGSLMHDATHWEDYYIAGRDGVSPELFNAWYLSLVSATVPDGISRDNTNMWLYIKGDAVGFVSNSDAVRDDTNCWFAVAREMGRIRAGFRTKYDWEALVGVDSNNREVMPGGVELLNITNSWSEFTRLSAVVRSMQQDQIVQDKLACMMGHAFDDFRRSQTFKNLPVAERNAIVSNIVEAARMDAFEAAARGLTNVVEQAGEP